MKVRRYATSVVPAAAVVLLVMSVVPALVVRGQSTPQTVRVSGLVSLLDQDMAACGLFANFAGVGNAPLDAITHAGDRTIDLVMYDLEHSPFDVAGLQTYIQFLLDPGAIARAGDVRASKTVIAQIPAYGRELDKNTWMVKNVLDVGVHGIVFPHIETPEQAFTAIRAMRYPQAPGAPDFEPDGIRGFGGRSHVVIATFEPLRGKETVEVLGWQKRVLAVCG